jgi:hypothetical protein
MTEADVTYTIEGRLHAGIAVGRLSRNMLGNITCEIVRVMEGDADVYGQIDQASIAGIEVRLTAAYIADARSGFEGDTHSEGDIVA